MQDWLRRTALLVPLVAGTMVLLLYATEPEARTCETWAALTVAQQAYLLHLKVAGATIALVALGLIWLLARRARALRLQTTPTGVGLLDVCVLVAGVVVVAGTTIAPQLIVPFLVLGLASTYFIFVGPLAAIGVYFGALLSAHAWNGDPAQERRFIRYSLAFYWLSVLLVVPGVFAILALHVAPICLN